MSKTSFNDFTNDEKLAHIMKMLDARQSGNKAEAKRLQLQIPIPVATFNSVKTLFGRKFIQSLLDKGYDFSLVEAEYGKNYIES